MPLFGLSFETLPFALLPLCFFPEFTWETPKNGPVATKIPPAPKSAHWITRRFWGFIHEHVLRNIALRYQEWMDLPRFCCGIWLLPFGLILKWSDGTRIEEAVAIQVARAAGLPVPKVLSYGDHPNCPYAQTSILMTRMPGYDLDQANRNQWMTKKEEETIKAELKGYLEAMRQWVSPWGPKRICSVSGTTIRSLRVFQSKIGPFESEQELNEFLIEPAAKDGFVSDEAFEEALEKVRRMQSLSHKVFSRMVISCPIT